MNKRHILIAILFAFAVFAVLAHAQDATDNAPADQPETKEEKTEDVTVTKANKEENPEPKPKKRKTRARRYDDDEYEEEKVKEATEHLEKEKEKKSKRKSRRESDYEDDYVDEYEEARARRRRRSRRYDDDYDRMEDDLESGRRRPRRPPHLDDYDAPRPEYREPPKRDPQEEKEREERFQQMRRRMEENSKKPGYGDIVSNRGEMAKAIEKKFEFVHWGEEHPFFTHWISQVSNWAPEGKIVDNFIKQEGRHVSVDVVAFSEKNNIDLSKELIYTGHIEFREELQGYDIQLSKKVQPYLAARPRAQPQAEKKAEL